MTTLPAGYGYGKSSAHLASIFNKLMTMNTPTPETDALDNSISVTTHTTMEQVLEHARKLERERDEAREKYAHWRKAHGHCSNSREVLIAERDQLRKVADELAKCLENPAIFQRMESIDAMCSYNSLPHVIAAKKGNEV